MRLPVVAVLTVATVSILQTAVPAGAARQTAADAAQAVCGLAAAGVCAARARRRTGPPRRWRLALAVGLAGWSLIRVWWLVRDAVDPGRPAAAAVPDVGFLVLPACVLFALLITAAAVPRHGVLATRRDDVVLPIDSVLVAGSLLAVAWTALPRGWFDRIGADPVASVIVAVYPLADLFLATMAALLLATRPAVRHGGAPVWLAAAGMIAFGVSDVLRAVHSGGQVLPPAAVAGWLLGPLLLALAALQPPPDSDATHIVREGPAWPHLLLPYVPVIASGVVIAARTATGGQLTPFEVYLGWLGLGLVVARQMFTIVDNTMLLGRVSEGQRRLQHQAYHDPLTGLANRTLFRERLIRALDAPAPRPTALLFADLDDFKLINDSFGHATGDRLLREVARRLLDCVPPEDLVARLSGDEFAVLIEDRTADAERIGRCILAALREPVQLDGHAVAAGASIGMVTTGSAGAPATTDAVAAADALLRRADAAMYAGKRRGKGTLVAYAGGADGGPHADLPHLLARALSGAPADAGFEVVYQPIVRFSDGGTVAVEALARWTDPVHGPIDPDVFVTVAERIGLVTAIDDFVLDRACADAATLADAYGRPIDVHVNVSASRLGPQGLEGSISRALHRHGVRPSRLVIEITETRRIPDLARAAQAANRLRASGVRMALDDFGSGFNALAQLHSLPVDIVKLDATLTDVDVAPHQAAALCRSVLAICRDLNVAVVAEGIETPERADALADLGCRLGQGYLFGPPMRLAALPVTPAQRRRRVST
ncbi:putative bifunctional diguanylate cyclase/phosphodiesterase [Mangrovihabitans endophyticus]|uniref:putative bifunctional diguanylate cyclase/phosphodiesterase n=1 Tax=Mangrovihabitans endophyticus TaxID=1751298 RepID=UPI001E333881|nr:bifunctional diguanylate cyclase/phosphodiesterase [Mangrovihabitans endophyticus]